MVLNRHSSFVYQRKKKKKKSNIKETIATKVKLFGCKSFLFSSIKDKYFSEEYQNYKFGTINRKSNLKTAETLIHENGIL